MRVLCLSENSLDYSSRAEVLAIGVAIAAVVINIFVWVWADEGTPCGILRCGFCIHVLSVVPIVVVPLARLLGF